MADYVFKFGNFIFPMKYINEGGYDSAPNQRQDLDPFTDQYGVTHRNSLQHTKSSVTITTREGLKWEEFQEIMNGLTSNYIIYGDRDANCEYLDMESLTMKTGHFYLDPSVKFTLKKFGEKMNAMTFTFTEY